MKAKFRNSLSDNSQVVIKQKYKPPALQHFGSVTQLTNKASADCDNDGNDNCTMLTQDMIGMNL